jgi:hypothetical protein
MTKSQLPPIQIILVNLKLLTVTFGYRKIQYLTINETVSYRNLQ